jgi:EpsI family protein
MPRWLPVVLILLVLLGVAAYGLLRPEVEPGREPTDVQHRLDSVPRTFDGWTCGDDTPLTDRAVNVGRFQAYLNRSYTHTPSEAAVSVMVLYGETGDIGAHDPKVCYAGSGWELSENPCRERVPESDTGQATPKVLWSARFRKQTGLLDVYWGWAANGDWVAADNPRFEFARHRRIFKLYAQRLLTGERPPVVADPIQEFLPKFLDRLNAAVFERPH